MSVHASVSEPGTRLTDAEIRLITELGNRLIDDGRASAIRRFAGDGGEAVMVILDENGVIEFGIEKCAGGYKGFNCDCDTVATDTDLALLLARFS